MKIGIILPSIERWNSHYGGACARIVNELVEQPLFNEDKIMVFCPNFSTKYKYPSTNYQPKLSSFWLWLDKTFSKLSLSFNGWFWIIPQYYKLRKYDLLHIHNRPHYALILRKLGYKGKIITHLHNDFNKSSNEFAKAFISASDLVISCSHKIADRLFEKDKENISKSIVLHNGVDASKFKFTSFKGREKTILFVGRIDEIKGVHNLLTAYENIINTNPDWKLNLAGSASFGDNSRLNDYELSIQNRINEINQNGGTITHLGYVNHDELPQLYQSVKIFCLPSIVHEAFGLVVVEAMLSGTPVVASNMGGIPEATGNTALLSETNVSALTEKLLESIENTAQAEELAKLAYDRAKNLFTKEISAQNQYNIYKHLLG